MKIGKHTKALIIANGILPSRKLLKVLVGQADYIVCADGGANSAYKLKMKPDIILGDLDSITTKAKKYFNNIPLVFIGDQYSTDLEKAIKHCISKKIKYIDIIGATGDRIDHTIGNLGCFKKFGVMAELKIIDPKGELFLIRKRIKLNTLNRKNVSLIPLSRCEGVTTKNLKYALSNDCMEVGVKEGTSNIAVSDYIVVNVKKGLLLIYHLYK
jgi:thiamine pyrophosphokinase